MQGGDEVKVKEIMATPVVASVTPDTPFKSVIELLVRAEVSALPVLETDGRLVGIVTEADLISKEAYGTRRHRALSLLGDVLSGRDHRWVGKAAGSVARDVMTKDVVVCAPEEDVAVVARRMLRHGIKRVPVLDRGALVGMVSRQDILGTFDRPDDLVRSDAEQALAHDPNRPDDAHVEVSVEDGVVRLTGDVRYPWDVRVVVSIVRDVPGVIDVVSTLHHREEPPPRAEAWIFGDR